MTYRFPEFNVDITNPTVTVNPIVNDLDPSTMTLSNNVVLTTANAEFGVKLEQVVIEDLTYTFASLETRVLARLSDFAV